MTASIYVATSYDTRHRVHEFMAKLEASAPGVFWLAYDWTAHTFDDDPFDVATRELRAISNSDAFVTLLPGGTGTYSEIGYAQALPWYAQWCAQALPEDPGGVLVSRGADDEHGWYPAPILEHCQHVPNEYAAVRLLVERWA